MAHLNQLILSPFFAALCIFKWIWCHLYRRARLSLHFSGYLQHLLRFTSRSGLQSVGRRSYGRKWHLQFLGQKMWVTCGWLKQSAVQSQPAAFSHRITAGLCHSHKQNDAVIFSFLCWVLLQSPASEWFDVWTCSQPDVGDKPLTGTGMSPPF